VLLAADIERSVAYAQIQERGAGIDYRLFLVPVVVGGGKRCIPSMTFE